MFENPREHPAAKPVRAEFLRDDEIAQIADRRPVGDDAREADQFFPAQNRKRKRFPHAALDHIARPLLRPIGAAEKIADPGQIDLLLIVGEREVIALPFHAATSLSIARLTSTFQKRRNASQLPHSEFARLPPRRGICQPLRR